MLQTGCRETLQRADVMRSRVLVRYSMLVRLPEADAYGGTGAEGGEEGAEGGSVCGKSGRW